MLELPVKEQSIEIREAGAGTLVTVIEILSPVNKRPGHEAFEAYRRKRRDFLRTEVHLMEIDLLRSGQRPPLATPLPEAPYFVFLSRGDKRPNVEIWPIRLQDSLPLLPVPLLDLDPDVPIDLGEAIRKVYEDAAYDLRIDYHREPPPPQIPPEDLAWMQGRVRDQV
jgi:hypothetical protein